MRGLHKSNVPLMSRFALPGAIRRGDVTTITKSSATSTLCRKPMSATVVAMMNNTRRLSTMTTTTTSSSSFRRYTGVLIGGVMAGAAVYMLVHWIAIIADNGHVTFCKPADTPDYLMPHYLRNNRARFTHYASIKGEDGIFMTPSDFVAAVLALPDDKIDETSLAAATSSLTELFKATDENSDGKLSYNEFAFLMILLITPKDDWEMLFTMYDEEGKGGLNLRQFRNMMRSRDGIAQKPCTNNGMVKRMFAAEADGNDNETRRNILTYSHFSTLRDELAREVQRAQFFRFDTEQTGAVSKESFARLITDSILGRHLPFFLADNIRQLGKAGGASGSAVTLDTWYAFCDMFQRSDAVTEAILMITASESTLSKEGLKRALASAGLPRPFRDDEVQLIFDIFDRNKDGTLEYDEFIGVIQAKMTFNITATPPEGRMDFFSRALYCTKQAIF